MENFESEDKENLPPGLKKTLTYKGIKKRKTQLSFSEKIRVLREKIDEKYNSWQTVNEFITNTLTTPEEMQVLMKDAKIRENTSTIP